MTQLPAGWRWSTVAQVGAVDLGRQRHPDWHHGPEMRPYLRVANVFEDRIDTTDLKEMDFSGVFERYKLEPGDVLLNEGQSPEFLGRPAIYRGVPEEVAFTNSLIRFRAGPDVTPEWALTVFRHYMHSGRFARESRITTNIAHLSVSRFKAIEFPVPPVGEQRRIVDILEDHLSRLNAADSGLASGDSRLRALELSALDKHFGARGAVASLGELVTDITAGRSFGSARAAAAEGEWGIVKVSAMTWGAFKAEENKAVPPELADPRFEIRQGDLLVSRANTSEYVGASVLVGPVRPRLLLSDKSLRLTPHRSVNAEWLWRALQAPSARRQISALATGTKDSMRNISQSSLRQILLPAADPAAQERAVQRFATVKGSLAAAQSSIAVQRRRSSVLRRSLLAAAFSGRLTGQLADVERVEELAGV